MSQYDLMLYPKIKLRHCDLYFMILPYILKTILCTIMILCFLSLYFYLIFSLYRYCCSRMIRVTDLEYFIFTAFTLKFGVKSLLSEGGDTGRGYM